MKKKNFHKENCIAKVRATIVTKCGTVISLMGRHAFEWQIIVDDRSGRITITNYENGDKARREFKKLKSINK